MRQAAHYPARALRCFVVAPGAFVEGALAVLLPWMIASKTLHSSWLGMASAAVVLAPMLGTLAAPVLSGKLGARRVTVAAAAAVVVCLGAAGASWAMGEAVIAFGWALGALAADAVCDLAFTVRLPLLARLCRQPLMRLSSGNWLWGLPGAALGSVLAGWAVNEGKLGALMVVLVLACALVAVGLAVLLPRESRRRPQPDAGFVRVFSAGFWTRRALVVTVGLVGFVFFVGPLDNLLIPAHLVAREQPASLFGYLMAAAGIGVAIGLVAVQSKSVVAHERALLLVGLVAVAGQIALLLWLPAAWIVIAGVLLTSALFAPLLPIMEAALLKVSSEANRALLLATVTTLVSVADVLGTLCLGAAVGLMGSDAALMIVLVGIGGGILIATRRHRAQ